MTIDQTLAERGNRYGSFQDHANIAQALQDVMRSEAGWELLAADQRQALTVIADKIARMLNGDPSYRDNWHDIVGYAKLVDDRMAADEAAEIADIEQAIDEDAAALKRSIDIAGGWREWNGGVRPFGDDSTKFDLRIRNGQELYGVKTDLMAWKHGNPSDDDEIVAYRLTPDPRT